MMQLSVTKAELENTSREQSNDLRSGTASIGCRVIALAIFAVAEAIVHLATAGFQIANEIRSNGRR